MNDPQSGAPQDAATIGAGGQYLTFALRDETFAIDIRAVREIIQVCPMTRVPLMPRFVRGVINLRGAVVPVIDLNARFGREAGALGKKTCIVIFQCRREADSLELGLLVDSVSEVVDIAHADIEPPPDFGGSVQRDFLRGMGKIGERFVVLLDPDKAFDVESMALLCERPREKALA